MTDVVQGDGYCLYHADCLDVLPALDAQAVDAVITDPPYGIELSNHSAGNHRRLQDYSMLGDESQLVGNQVNEWASSQNLATIFFASPSKPWPGKWRSRLVWDKGGAVGGGGDPFLCWKQTWELIQVARNSRLNGQRDPAVLQFWTIPQYSELHPAQKPLALMEYLVLKTTHPADIVLDPFMGSGTTGVAAIKNGRRFIGVELDSTYFQIACDRIADAARTARREWKPLQDTQMHNDLPLFQNGDPHG